MNAGMGFGYYLFKELSFLIIWIIGGLFIIYK